MAFSKPHDAKDTILEVSQSQNIEIPEPSRILQLTHVYYEGVTGPKVLGKKYFVTQYNVAFLVDLATKKVPIGMLAWPSVYKAIEKIILLQTERFSDPRPIKIKLSHPELRATAFRPLANLNEYLLPYLQEAADLPSGPLSIIIRSEHRHGTRIPEDLA